MALVIASEGVGYRRACRLAGLRESRARDVQRAARRLGIDELHLRRKAERDAMTYSKRDRAAIEAVFQGNATMRQLIRALKASDKRTAMLERRWVS